MIVDTMSFDEITEYLNNTIFTSERINEILWKHIFPNENKYRRAVIKWKQNPNHSQYKIFSPITSKREHEEELVYIPFGVDIKYNDFVLFSTFHYRGKKWVAFKLGGNRIMFYSWHSIQRYSERFLKEPNPIIDYQFIGDMLIYNTRQHLTNYTYKGKTTDMYVSTDGGFLGCTHKNYILIKTFISHDEYFANQAALDKEAFEIVKMSKKQEFGYWISRDAS